MFFDRHDNSLLPQFSNQLIKFTTPIKIQMHPSVGPAVFCGRSLNQKQTHNDHRRPRFSCASKNTRNTLQLFCGRPDTNDLHANRYCASKVTRETPLRLRCLSGTPLRGVWDRRIPQAPPCGRSSRPGPSSWPRAPLHSLHLPPPGQPPACNSLARRAKGIPTVPRFLCF